MRNTACERDTNFRAAEPVDGSVRLDLQHDRLLKLNPVASDICQLLAEGNSEHQIVLAIAEKYDADAERVAADVRAFLQRIAELQITPESVAPVDLPPSTGPGKAAQSFPWYAAECGMPKPRPRLATVLRAWSGLLAFDFVLSLLSLKVLCRCVERWSVRPRRSDDPDVIGRVCSAVEHACVWYPKKALCLQRSAVTACLLRDQGLAARLCIGARPMPLLAHAWVEVEGAVVNDWPKVKNLYGSLTSY